MIERFCPTLSGGTLRREFRSAVGAFGVLMLLGFLGAAAFPTFAQEQFAHLTAQLSALGLTQDISHARMLRLLFTNNASASLFSLLQGVIPFLFLSVLALGTNALLLGALAAIYFANGAGLGFYLVGILPHGVFELPALVLSCALGLLVCRAGTDRLRRVEGAVPFLLRLRDCLRVFFCVCLPLLLAAALIETFVTPALLAAFV